jgi:hypothetical protein
MLSLPTCSRGGRSLSGCWCGLGTCSHTLLPPPTGQNKWVWEGRGGRSTQRPPVFLMVISRYTYSPCPRTPIQGGSHVVGVSGGRGPLPNIPQHGSSSNKLGMPDNHPKCVSPATTCHDQPQVRIMFSQSQQVVDCCVQQVLCNQGMVYCIGRAVCANLSSRSPRDCVQVEAD